MTIINQLKNGLGIAIATVALSIGCGEIPNQDLNNFIKYKQNKPQLIITSNPVTNGTVGGDYFYPVETNVPDVDCNLVKAPAEIEMQDNILQGRLNHAGSEIINIKCSAEDLKDAYQKYELNVEPGKLRDISYDRIDYFSVPYTTFDGQEKIEDFAVVCETNFCPDLYQDDSYWSKRIKGVEKAVKLVLNTTKSSLLEENELSKNYTGAYRALITNLVTRPIEVHLNADSTCTDKQLIGTNYGNAICDFLYDWITPTTGKWGYSNCLDPRYPEKCVNSKTYLDPSSVEANSIAIHEFDHTANFLIVDSPFSENMAYPMQIVLSHNNGKNMNINSFCDMDYFNVQGAETPQFYLFSNLCKNYGFDIDNITQLNDFMRRDYLSYNYRDSVNYPTREIKCSLDEIVNNNTYDTFVKYGCNNSYSTHKIYCNLTNSNSFFYVEPLQCKPRILLP